VLERANALLRDPDLERCAANGVVSGKPPCHVTWISRVGASDKGRTQLPQPRNSSTTARSDFERTRVHRTCNSHVGEVHPGDRRAPKPCRFVAFASTSGLPCRAKGQGKPRWRLQQGRARIAARQC
jgi:hypothetical protein